ncbi:hypothetical protein IQ06DRAFT_292895 [Phaeosphaeriaceae sp. SRC1lsM3a]|nr:hypothetical protein IQ06DRAFT_292895 [Stagonospora sp. SRC1lsM3a]
MAQVDQYAEKLVPNVHETGRDVAPTPPPTLQKPRRFWEKLGLYNMAVLLLGTVAVGIALAFLFFIWGAATHSQRSFPELWSSIVEKKWATRVVTLSSVLIRIATAAQLGVFAAILAALILEQVGVATEDLPLVSMIRCLNSGPHSLALSVVNSFFTKALFPYSLLIVLAILNAFALQFTSTILLTDFGDTNVVMETTRKNITFGLNRNVATGINPKGINTYGGLDYWKTGPAIYQRFAEFKENGSQTEDYVDTGKTLRGFPPHYMDSDRYHLRDYSGPMTVVDTRVICVKPTVSNVSVNVDPSQDDPTIKANFNWKSSIPNLEANKADQGKGFDINCTLPTAGNYDIKKDWQISLCSIGVDVARLLGGIISDDRDADYPLGKTSANLFLNATGSRRDWINAFGNDTQMERADTAKPLWTHFTRSNVTIDFSLCFINPLPASYEVEVSSPDDGIDSSILWDPATATFNTTWIRHMYGATKEHYTIEDRGQLRLENKANWTTSGVQQVWNITTDEFIWDTLSRYDYAAAHSFDDMAGVGVGLTTMFTSGSLPDYSVHRTHAAVFQDIIQKTGNPAVALQALTTILLQMAYYDFLSEYDVSAPAKWKTSAILNIPNQWKAFGVVLGLLVVHFTLVITAVRLFLARTEMSLLGNAWQAVSQVVSADTAGVLHEGATTTDREVRGTMKQSGVADGKVRIAKSVASGRMEATAVRQRYGATYSAPVGQV